MFESPIRESKLELKGLLSSRLSGFYQLLVHCFDRELSLKLTRNALGFIFKLIDNADANKLNCVSLNSVEHYQLADQYLGRKHINDFGIIYAPHFLDHVGHNGGLIKLKS